MIIFMITAVCLIIIKPKISAVPVHSSTVNGTNVNSSMQGDSVRQSIETYDVRGLTTSSAYPVIQDSKWQSLEQEQNKHDTDGEDSGCGLLGCKKGYHCALCHTPNWEMSTACIPVGAEC